MKKLMFALGTAAALVGMADIESVNTVGFDTKGCDKGKFYILGIQFEGCDGTMDINKLVSGFTGVDFDEDFTFRATAPQIQVPNAVGYDVYYLLNDGYYVTESGNEEYMSGWCDAYGTIAGCTAANAEVSGVLTAGVSAWVKDVGAAETFVQAGQVPGDDTIEVTAPVAFALRANAFPVAFNLNDETRVSYTGLKAAQFDEAFAFRATAPQIQVPNGVGYDVYYYLEDGYYVTESGEEQYKPGWCDAYGTIAGCTEANAEVSGEVTAGQGFWTKGVGSEFKMTFKK